MRIKVEQRHIDNGKCGDRALCAVALAITQRLKDGYVSDVAAGGISGDCALASIWEGNSWNTAKEIGLNYRLSKRTTEWINDFDADVIEVKPFQFNMNIPKEYLKHD